MFRHRRKHAPVRSILQLISIIGILATALHFYTHPLPVSGTVSNWWQGSEPQKQQFTTQAIYYGEIAILVAIILGLLYCLFRLTYSWLQLGIPLITEIDRMEGLDFEHYVARLLRHQGYVATVTKASGDLGVDIVAQKGQHRYAVQTKRHAKPISRQAISDAVAGMGYYHCDQAMVVTNSTFTPGAITLAQSNGCMLVDRTELTRWIGRYR